LCGYQFDDVGDEEMAGDEGVEEATEDEVLFSIVVATDAD
jgi:hypothetical protein